MSLFDLTRALIGETLGLVSVLRLKGPRLSVSVEKLLLVWSRSRSVFFIQSGLGLVSDIKFQSRHLKKC